MGQSIALAHARGAHLPLANTSILCSFSASSETKRHILMPCIVAYLAMYVFPNGGSPLKIFSAPKKMLPLKKNHPSIKNEGAPLASLSINTWANRTAPQFEGGWGPWGKPGGKIPLTRVPWGSQEDRKSRSSKAQLLFSQAVSFQGCCLGISV